MKEVKKIEQCIEGLAVENLLKTSKSREELLENMGRAASEVDQCYASNGGRTWDMRLDLRLLVEGKAEEVTRLKLGSYPPEDEPTSLRTQSMIKEKSNSLVGQYAPMWKSIPSFWRSVADDSPVFAWTGLAVLAGGLVYAGNQLVKGILDFIPKGPAMLFVVPWEELNPFNTGPLA